MRTKARLSLSALICLAFPSTAAHAIGFGDIVSQSAIGEPFRAEVRLHGVKPDEGGECLRLSQGQISEGIPELTGAQIGLRQVNGQWRAIITRSTPVFDPVIRMTLEETCSARLRRAYTLLLPLPAELVAPVASAPPAPRRVTPTQSVPRSAGAAPHSAGAAFGSDALGGTWTLPEPSSINALARKLYPDSRRDRRAFVDATRRANAVERSIRSARQRLAKGTTLVIPSPEEIEAARKRIDSRRAAAPDQAVAKANAPGKKPILRDAPPSAEQILSEPTATAEAPPEAKPAPARGDRLMIMGDAPDVSGFKLSLQLGDPSIVDRTTETEREQLRREQQMLMVLDSKIITQLELRDRIARLQALQETLNAELEAQQAGTPGSTGTPAQEPTAAAAYPDETPTAPDQAPNAQGPVIDAVTPAAQPSSDESATETSGLIDTLMAWWRPLAVSALVLLLALMWWRRRQPPVTDEDELDALASLSRGADDEPNAAQPAVETSASTHGGDADSFDYSTAEWNGEPPAELDHSVAPIDIDENYLAEEHASAVELADIMMSFGRVHGAAETLSDFIRGNPTQAVQPWIKLLEVYRAAKMKAEFEGLTRQLNKTFNVKIIEWDDFESAIKALGSIEELPHIARTLQSCWGTTDCQAYIHGLLRDTRGGTRQGFPLGAVDEFLLLLAVLEDQLGPYRMSPDNTGDDAAAAAAAAIPAAAASAQNDAESDASAAAEAPNAAGDNRAAVPDQVGTESYLPDIDFDVDSQIAPFKADADETDTPSAYTGSTGLDFHLDSDAEASPMFPHMEPDDAAKSSPPETRTAGLDFDVVSDPTPTDAEGPAFRPTEEEEKSVSRTFVQTNVDFRIGEGDEPDDSKAEKDKQDTRRRQDRR